MSAVNRLSLPSLLSAQFVCLLLNIISLSLPEFLGFILLGRYTFGKTLANTKFDFLQIHSFRSELLVDFASLSARNASIDSLARHRGRLCAQRVHGLRLRLCVGGGPGNLRFQTAGPEKYLFDAFFRGGGGGFFGGS